MPKRKTAKQPAKRSSRGMSPIVQFGVVFVIVAAMLLLMYAVKQSP